MSIFRFGKELFQALKGVIFLTASTLVFSVFQVHAQGTDRNILLKTSVRFSDDAENEYKEETEIFLQRINLHLVLEGGAKLEVRAGNPIAFYYTLKNVGNQDADYHLSTSLLNDLPEGITGYTIYKSEEDATAFNFMNEAAVVYSSALPDEDDRRVNTHRINIGKSYKFILELTTESNLKEPKTIHFYFGGKYAPQNDDVHHYGDWSNTNPEEYVLRAENTLKIRLPEKEYDSSDLMYTGLAGRENIDLWNKPGENANPFISGSPVEILTFLNNSPKEFWIRLENDSKEQKVYLIDIQEADGWEVEIYNSKGERVSYHGTGPDPIDLDSFVLSGSSGEKSFSDFRVVVTPPQVEAKEAWNLQPIDSAEVRNTNSGSDNIYEQPLALIVYDVRANVVVDQLLIHFQQAKEIKEIFISSDTDRNSNVLANMDKVISYSIKNKGNVASLLNVNYSSDSRDVQRDRKKLYNSFGEEQANNSVLERFLPGEEARIERELLFVEKAQVVEGRKAKISVVLTDPNLRDFLRGLEHTFTFVEPKIEILKTIHELSNCRNINSYSGALRDGKKVDPQNCLRVNLEVQNITDHEYHPVGAIVRFPVPAGLAYVPGSFHFNGVPAEVTHSDEDGALTYDFGDLTGGEEHSFHFALKFKDGNNSETSSVSSATLTPSHGVGN